MIHTSKFSEAWKVQSIGEVCTSIVPGRNKPDFSVAGEYPWLTIDDLQQFYLYNSKLGYRVSKAALDRANGKTVPNNSVIMSCVGQFGIVGIAKTELVINQQLHAFICPPEIDSYFLAMALIWQKPYMERIATKTTVSYMNKAACESIPIPVPPLPEQRKIAAILSTWDEAIDLTERLIAAKQRRNQALMQRLLLVNQKDESPKHRFPAFSGSWQQVQFGDIFERVTRKNSIGNNNVLTISAQHGLISQTEFFNKIVASESLSGYYLLKRGEFAYNKSYSAGYPYGAFKRQDAYDAGVLSTLYVCFRFKSSDVNSDYFVHFFEAGGMNHGVYSIAQEGARNHGLLNMSVNDLFALPLHIPSLDEQNALASLFNDLDKELALHQQKLAALRRQKQGLMQQLLTGRVRVAG